jgi:hypothetical protein
MTEKFSGTIDGTKLVILFQNLCCKRLGVIHLSVKVAATFFGYPTSACFLLL